MYFKIFYIHTYSQFIKKYNNVDRLKFKKYMLKKGLEKKNTIIFYFHTSYNKKLVEIRFETNYLK